MREKDEPHLSHQEHTVAHVQYIQQFVCTSCGSGGPAYENIFKPTGQCRSCGAPAGKIEVESVDRVIDLQHTILAIHAPNPGKDVEDFIEQLRAKHIRVISLGDVLPPEQPVVLAVKPIEHIVKSVPFVLAFWTPEVEEDPLARLTMDTALLVGNAIAPIYPTHADMESSPPGLQSRVGTILRVGLTDSPGLVSPSHVINDLVQFMQPTGNIA